MKNTNLYELLGAELFDSLGIARQHFYQTLPKFAALHGRQDELCRAWVVLDHLLDQLIEGHRESRENLFKE